MAIIEREDKVNGFGSHKRCFHCGKKAWNKKGYVQVILWRGKVDGDEIILHPECAMHMATRIISDVVDCEFPTKGFNPYYSDISGSDEEMGEVTG